MQVNLDCRKPCPQFGNFLIAGEKGTEVCTKVCSENAERGVSMLRYSIGNGRIISRGLKQYKNNSAMLKKHDIVYNWMHNTISVINQKTGEIIRTFRNYGNPYIDRLDAKKYLGRKLWAMIFNPQEFLPHGFISALEKANALEKGHKPSV